MIGVVKVKTSESFILDIGSPLDAMLGGLEFDGVTKKNKPNIPVGEWSIVEFHNIVNTQEAKLVVSTRDTPAIRKISLESLREGQLYGYHHIVII